MVSDRRGIPNSFRTTRMELHTLKDLYLVFLLLCVWWLLSNLVQGSDVTLHDVSHVNAFVHLSFYPVNIAVVRGSQATGYVNVTVQSDVTPDVPLKLHMCCVDAEVAIMDDPSHVIELPRNQSSTIFNISMTGLVLGRTAIRFYISRNVSVSSDYYDKGAIDQISKFTSTMMDENEETSKPANLILTEMTEAPIETTSSGIKSTETSTKYQEKSQRPTSSPRPHSSTTLPGASDANLLRLPPKKRPRKPRSISSVNFNVSNYPEENLQIWWLPSKYHVMVLNPPNHAEAFLNYVVMVMIAVNLVGIGGQVDTEEVLYLLKKPLAVGVGLFCRFGVIPALALGLVELLQPSKLVSLGVLGLVCSPAEGANNLLVLLVEGDLTLSATVTTINNFATVAMLPLWTILFETRIYSEPGRVKIPFKEIFIIFGYMTCSLTAGCFLQRRFPKQYNRFWLYLPAWTVFTFAFILAVQAYNSHFIVQLVTVQIFFLAAMLAASGFIFGAAVAFIARLSKSRLLVLTVETGIRTTYSISLLLVASLDAPDGDIAKTTPVLASFLTLLPAFTVGIIYRMVHKYRTRNYAETECSYLASNEDLSELCNGPEVVDTKETSM